MAGPARERLLPPLAVIAVLHLAGWGLLLVAAPGRTGLAGLGVLAYTFGLRHAFDADHISAIDNTTRRLLAAGRPAEAVGLYFSLGHSTVVAALALGLALAARTVAAHLPGLQAVGGLLGLGVSAGFLYLIAGLNLGVLLQTARAFRSLGGAPGGAEPTPALPAGLMGRLLQGLFRLVDTAPRMYPVGVLFGLGFDTASEVALLAVSAGAVSRHLPLTAVMDLPLLFAAGMSLLDTADGAFMARAYGWAFTSPLRRAYYNLTVTGLSVLVALLVGTVEVVQVAAAALPLRAGFLAPIQRLNFVAMGYLIVGLFVLTWAVAYALWRFGRLERRWTPRSD